MKPQEEIQLVGGLLDLPILDCDGRYCGIVDDVEFADEGGTPRVHALLVGPGAYRGRLPAWAFGLVRRLAGTHVTRVPWSAVKAIASAVELRLSAGELGLHHFEKHAERLLPHRGAM